jgi:hypothetical protein
MLSIFELLNRSPLLKHGRVDLPMKLEFRSTKIVRRLLRCLDRLDASVVEWDAFLSEGELKTPRPWLAVTLPVEAGMTAEGVFHYLNLLVDDLARLVGFLLTHRESAIPEGKGFGKLKHRLNRGQIEVSEAMRSLFQRLDEEASWWTLGFLWGKGSRQRIVHYGDMVVLSGINPTRRIEDETSRHAHRGRRAHRAK